MEVRFRPSVLSRRFSLSSAIFAIFASRSKSVARKEPIVLWDLGDGATRRQVILFVAIMAAAIDGISAFEHTLQSQLSQSNESVPPLIEAIWIQDVERVKRLLADGADPEATTRREPSSAAIGLLGGGRLLRMRTARRPCFSPRSRRSIEQRDCWLRRTATTCR